MNWNDTTLIAERHRIGTRFNAVSSCDGCPNGVCLMDDSFLLSEHKRKIRRDGNGHYRNESLHFRVKPDTRRMLSLLSPLLPFLPLPPILAPTLYTVQRALPYRVLISSTARPLIYSTTTVVVVVSLSATTDGARREAPTLELWW